MKLQALLAATLVLLLSGLAGCSKPLTVEQQVIATIRQMEERIENGERRPFMKFVAEDFQGQDEMITRDQLRALVIFQLNRHQRLHAQLFPIRVLDTGDGTATATFRALITGGPRWIPESGQVYDFETWWRRDDNSWLLRKANWEPVLLEEALQEAL